MKEIADFLHLKERIVRRFIEKEKTGQRPAVKVIPQKTNNVTIIFIVAIILLGVIAYFNSVHNKFLYDDLKLIENNAYIKNWHKIAKIFTADSFAGSGVKSNFYRPLQLLTYMVDYRIWKFNVVGYHISNVLLHILVGLSLYFLITILFEDKILSFFTSILYIIHPVHTEAITYISGRADPLSTFFILLALIFYIKTIRSDNLIFAYLLSLSFVLSLLSKEHSLILPALILLYHYTFREKIKMKPFAAIFGIAIIYIILRATILHFPSPTAINSQLFLQRLAGFLIAIPGYIQLLFFPFHLHMEYGVIPHSFNNSLYMTLGVIILASSVIYAFLIRNANKLVFFSVGWFLLTILPVSNLFAINAYMAEHWLYIPSIGFFLLLANCLNYIYQNKRYRILMIIFLAAIITFYSYLTIKQNSYWSDPINFYEKTLKYSANNPRMYCNLADEYFKTGSYEKAIDACLKAIKIDPSSALSYHTLGCIYSKTNKKTDAIRAFQKAVQLDPSLAEAYNNLGVVYAEAGRKEEAIDAYKKAIEINPEYEEAYSNLGIEYFSSKNPDKEQAVELFQKAIELNPDYAEAYYNLSRVYKAIGKEADAIKLRQKAKSLNPNLQ